MEFYRKYTGKAFTYNSKLSVEHHCDDSDNNYENSIYYVKFF